MFSPICFLVTLLFDLCFKSWIIYVWVTTLIYKSSVWSFFISSYKLSRWKGRKSTKKVMISQPNSFCKFLSVSWALIVVWKVFRSSFQIIKAWITDIFSTPERYLKNVLLPFVLAFSLLINRIIRNIFNSKDPKGTSYPPLDVKNVFISKIRQNADNRLTIGAANLKVGFPKLER